MFINLRAIIVPKGCISLKQWISTWLHIRITRELLKKINARALCQSNKIKNLWGWVLDIGIFGELSK